MQMNHNAKVQKLLSPNINGIPIQAKQSNSNQFIHTTRK